MRTTRPSRPTPTSHCVTNRHVCGSSSFSPNCSRPGSAPTSPWPPRANCGRPNGARPRICAGVPGSSASTPSDVAGTAVTTSRRRHDSRPTSSCSTNGGTETYASCATRRTVTPQASQSSLGVRRHRSHGSGHLPSRSSGCVAERRAVRGQTGRARSEGCRPPDDAGRTLRALPERPRSPSRCSARPRRPQAEHPRALVRRVDGVS